MQPLFASLIVLVIDLAIAAGLEHVHADWKQRDRLPWSDATSADAAAVFPVRLKAL
jgi:hypothetical protein